MRCKYQKKCELYQPFNRVCCHSGDYYGIDRKCGKYRDLEENNL